MGIRGRKPKPIELKIVQGNPGNRPLPEPPPFEKGLGECPDWLKGIARECWNEITEQLNRAGVLAKADRHVVEQYCVAYAAWRECVDFIERHGRVFILRDEQNKVKYLQQFPQTTLERSYNRQLAELGALLGLSPSARARLGVKSDGAPTNDKEKRIFGE